MIALVVGCGAEPEPPTASSEAEWRATTFEAKRVAGSCYWNAKDIVDPDAWRPTGDEIEAAFVRVESAGGSDAHYLLLSANVVEPDDLIYSAVVSEDKNVRFGPQSGLEGVAGSIVDDVGIPIGAGRSDDSRVSPCMRALVPKDLRPGNYRVWAGGMSAPIRVVAEGESDGVSMANRGKLQAEF